MKNIWTIAVREYKAYYSNFIAYVFIFFMLLIIGIVFYNSIVISMNSFGQIPPPNVQIVIGPLMFLLVFACPAFTMRLLSEEQRLGTIELLLTAPVRDWELVVGKWLGSFLFVLTNVAVTFIYPIALQWLITPGIDQGPLVSGYLGVLLVAGAFLGMGVAISSFFSNQVASYIVTFGVIVVFWWIFGIFSQVGGPQSAVFRFLDMGSQFYDSLYQGEISLSGVVYLLSLIAGFLTLGTVSVETRRWR